MEKHNAKFRSFAEQAIPWIVLAVLLFYTYAKFVQHPYSGFRLSPEGDVFAIYVKNAGQPPLRLGDKVLRIDVLNWEDFKSDYRKILFKGVKPGQVVPLLIEREGEQIEISWTYPGPNAREVIDLIVNEGWLAFVFWLVGTLTFLHLRPKDERWALMMAFNYLTAVWLAAGSGVSFYHTWGSAFILRMAIWLCVPVYLQFHWIYPRPFRKLPAPVTWSVYGVASALAVAELFQLLPQDTYFMGFLLAIGGSMVFLIAHVILQAEARRDLRLLLIATLLALVPAIILGFLGTFSTIPTPSGAAAIGLPFLPLAYFYAVYRRQLGYAELRVNRWISIIIFMILLGAISAVLMTIGGLWIDSVGNALWYGGLVVLLLALFSIWSFSGFQMFVERYLLRIPLPPRNLLEVYSARLATSASLPSLLKLLADEVLPSLLVRQFAFLKIEHNFPELLLAKGITGERALSGCTVASLMLASGSYRPAALLNDGQPCPWAHLVLPLKVGDSTIGYWLFGQRDPDDFYASSEIPIFQSLANQTAIALSNILQTERLRAMYHADVNRREEERLHLAHDLHDSVLNQLAVLQMNLGESEQSQQFQEAYEDLTQRLREIVSDLRPPMLNYGLKPAIDDLADKLGERSDAPVNVVADLQTDGSRYPLKTELHLFRIVQQACENALRHARAGTIRISGKLSAQEICLDIEDDGIGFEVGESLQLDGLIAKKHFGLAGMLERAGIIGAEVTIESATKAGTHIRIRWQARRN